MSTKFKPNDKVICINDQYSGQIEPVRKGTIYTIKDCFDMGARSQYYQVTLIETPRAGRWDHSRFELVARLDNGLVNAQMSLNNILPAIQGPGKVNCGCYIGLFKVELCAQHKGGDDVQ